MKRTLQLISVLLIAISGLGCSAGPAQKPINSVSDKPTPEETRKETTIAEEARRDTPTPEKASKESPTPEATKRVGKWVYKKTEAQEIVFENGKKLNTRLYKLKYIRSLVTKNGTTFLILSGVGCTECDANISIYIHNPADGDMKGESEQQSYVYPGKIHFYEDNTFISKSRMFVGSCLPDRDNMIIWYQKELNDEKKWIASAHVVDVVKEKLVGKTVKKNIPNLQLSLELTKSKKCLEVSGINRTSEP